MAKSIDSGFAASPSLTRRKISAHARIAHRIYPPPAYPESVSPIGRFDCVDACSRNNLWFWAEKWGVTEIQLKIAVSRVGIFPDAVIREVSGRR